MSSADERAQLLEQTVMQRVKLRPQFCFSSPYWGSVEILALTIMLETGDIRRFASVGNYASYCRCVGSQKLSNSEKKARATPRTQQVIWPGRLSKRPTSPSATTPRLKASMRKKAKTKIVVALKAVAHRLCRACYDIMRDQVAFDVTKASNRSKFIRLGWAVSSQWGWLTTIRFD